MNKRVPLFLFLWISLLAFGFDLTHMLYHLIESPTLWSFSGVPLKLAMKILVFLIPLILLLTRKRWLPAAALFILTAILFSNPVLASSQACRHARELLGKSGVSRDAEENLFGKIKLSPPHGSFPSDMDKVTWWGEFQPFEFWERTDFDAVWIRPDGSEAARQKFYPSKCRLAKTTLRTEDQPGGELQSGMWNVLVTCGDYLIDKKPFAVLPSPSAAPSGPDSPRPSKESAMIWAEDAVKE